MSEEISFLSDLKKRYDALITNQWSPQLGGLLLGLINVMMFAYARPLSISDGIRNWGDWISKPLGFSQEGLLSPLLYSTSVIDLGLIGGAFTASLLAKEFGIRIPPVWELLKGFIGGLFMGLGINLSVGCTIGGFFSALSAFSLSGIGMMIGLTLGAFLGLKYLLWELDRWGVALNQVQGSDSGKTLNPLKHVHGQGKSVRGWKNFQLYIGALAFLFILIFAFGYDKIGYAERGGLLLFGFALGIINQRSRLCFVRAFREPFMTGDGEHAKAVIIALIISITGFSILKWTGLRPEDTFVHSSFWLGSLVGGVIFGIGMVLAGGCGIGTLWRVGEGNVKLLIALAGFTLSSSLSRRFLEHNGLTSYLGKSIFLPDLLGWELAWLGLLALLALWYLLISWNELKGKFVLI